MNFIFDTHAHYDDTAFDSDRDEILKLLPEKGVAGVINAGVDVNSSVKSVELSKKYGYIYSAVGIHPENVDKNEDIEELVKIINNSEKIVAVGEIGLDYHFRDDNKELQKKLFINQINIANEHSLPIIVHSRDAYGDTLEILKKMRPKGIFHCFSGSVEISKEIVKLGMFLGIGGLVTFKNVKNLIEVVRENSLSNMVLETDAPYMAPTSFRGKRCDSSLIKFTASKIAEIKNIDVEEVLRITKENAENLFGIK